MDVSRASDRAVAELLERRVAELEPIQRDYHEAVWTMNLTGDPRDAEASGRLDERIRSILARRDDYAAVRALLEGGGAADPRLQRQLVLLELMHRPHQIAPEKIAELVRIEKSLENRFNAFRARLDGELVGDNRIREILRSSADDEERRAAWEASKQVGREVVEDLLRLVRLRNEAARDLGFRDHYSLMLEVDELDEGELFRLLDDLERRTRPLFEAYRDDLERGLARRFGVSRDALRPWHYGDPFFQEAPPTELDFDAFYRAHDVVELTERFFAAVGFDIGELLARADLYEKPGKCQHAFCLSVDRAADVRVLCNVRPTEHWMGTMLHEFGHAVYDYHIDRSLPLLLREPAHTLTTEASAMLFGRLSKNAAWLQRYAGVDPKAAAEIGAETARTVRSQLLVQTRWCLVMCFMERELYRDPERDLDRLWWDLVERFQGVRRPDGRRAPDWASKIHFCVAPVYYHNYMLGEMMASQLEHALRERVVSGAADPDDRYVSSPEIGAFLRDRLYRAGKSVDWRQALRGATGGDLSASAFVADLARA